MAIAPKGKKVTGTKKADKITWSSTKPWKTNLTVSAGAGNDVINFKKSNYNNTIKGENGNDKIYGNAGNDSVYGEAGNDSLYGGVANDYLNGGADIRPYIYEFTIDKTANNKMEITMCIAAGNDYNLKVETVLSAMEKYTEGFKITFSCSHRVKILADGKEIL